MSDRAISTTEAKLNLGRKLFRRVQKDHLGLPADPTAFAALQRASKEGGQKPPTWLEKKLLFDDNRSTVSAYRAAGLSDEKIYELLNG